MTIVSKGILSSVNTVFDGSSVIGVVGAGAMGAGIAQVAAMNGHRVILADAQPAAHQRAIDGIKASLTRDVLKGRRVQADADAIVARISLAGGVSEMELTAFAKCDLVIEAIVEDLSVKRTLFRNLEAVLHDDAILASNTSSLSIAAIGGACKRADHVVGLHFFNPAPIMPLVEIIPSIATAPDVAARIRALATAWGKTTVMASDTPGFIVNRIARPFYGEAMRMLEEGIADVATIDWAMREVGGFRMGPFELTDFIGQDVNFAVTRSVFDATFNDPRYRPSIAQQRLVEAGLLGRKSGRGFYDYAEDAVKPEATRDNVLGQTIVDRILALLVNEAVDAVHLRIASGADIEIAMTTGVNYPRGLLAWGDQIGAGSVLARLDALHDEYGDDRYRASVRLRRIVRNGGTLA